MFSIREEEELTESTKDEVPEHFNQYGPMKPDLANDMEPGMSVHGTNTVGDIRTEILEIGQDHLCGVYKATIPIARLRELVDQDDLDDFVSYKCPECLKCIKCRV